MTQPGTFKFALACGVAAAWVDITSDVLFEEGTIPFEEGRTSGFDDPGPGVWSFTLKNGDGKYTPDNSSSSLATKVTEGMGAVMQLDGQLFAGTIRGLPLIFPALRKADQARIRFTVDDALGTIARRTLDELSLELWRAAGGLLRWSLEDPAGSNAAIEQYQSPPLNIVQGDVSPVFGVTSTSIPFASVEMAGIVTGPSLAVGDFYNTPLPTFGYGTGTCGSIGFWIELVTATAPGSTVVQWRTRALASMNAGMAGNGSLNMQANGGSTVVGVPMTVGRAYYVAITSSTVFGGGVWTTSFTLWIDGVNYGTSTSTTTSATLTDYERSPRSIVLSSSSGTFTARYSHLTHTLNRLDESPVNYSTEAARLQALAAAMSEVTFDTIPTLSTAAIGRANVEGQSGLAAVLDVVRTEQGSVWVETGGSLTAPTPKVKIAARNPGRARDYTFDVSEILDPIPFVRSLTNTVEQFTANGPDMSVTYEDTTLIPKVGKASSSETVLLRDVVDLFAYAGDRVNRGKPSGYPIVSITLDATALNRWTDFNTIRQGYRLGVTGLPSTVFGYSTWDGFVVGREIEATQREDGQPQIFITYYLTPWRPVAVYDTAVYDATTSVYAF